MAPITTPPAAVLSQLTYLFGPALVENSAQTVDTDSVAFCLHSTPGDFPRPTYVQAAGFNQQGQLRCEMLIPLLKAQVSTHQRAMYMNFSLFSKILNDNLAFEPSPEFAPELWAEWQQEFYTDFKQHSIQRDESLTGSEKVVQWMWNAFSEYTFDTHNFKLKEEMP